MGSRRSLGGAPARPPPAHRPCFRSAAHNGWSAGSRPRRARCSALPVCSARCPVPSCAQLTGSAWATGGSGWWSKPPARPGTGRPGHALPRAWPSLVPLAPQPAALFCVSAGRSTAVLHRFSDVCWAHGGSGSTRRGRNRAGVRGRGGGSFGQSATTSPPPALSRRTAATATAQRGETAGRFSAQWAAAGARAAGYVRVYQPEPSRPKAEREPSCFGKNICLL